MAYIITDKTLRGKTINSPGNAFDGKVYFKYRNGVIPGPDPDPGGGGTGLPSWTNWEFSGTPQTAVSNFVAAPAPTKNVFYVDSDGGNDSWLGTTTAQPFRTVAKARTVQTEGDHIYFKRGGVWSEALHPLSGGSYIKSGLNENQKTVIGFYGSSGPRPRFTLSGPAINTYNRGGLRHIIFDGLHFDAELKDPSHPSFTDGSQAGCDLQFHGGNTYDVTLQDCLIDHSELKIQPSSSNNNFPGIVEKVRLINLIFTGAYTISSGSDDADKPSNMFVSPMYDLQCRGITFDYGGWNPSAYGAAANMFNHNVYLVASSDPNVGNSYLWENCIVCRGSSHGIHGRPGGTYRNMFFSRNAIQLQIGYAKTAMGAGTTPLVEDSVFSEGYSMWKGPGYDPGDENLRSGAKWGLNFENYGGAQITARNNIVQIGYVQGDDQPPSTNTVGFRTQGALYSDVNNIIWQYPNQTGSYGNPGRTLGDYDAYLNGTGSFDSFMNKVKSRPLRGWDYRYTAEAINAYIKAGYEA